jgi:hypothetical protein
VYKALLSEPALTSTPLTGNADDQLKVWPLPERPLIVIDWPGQFDATDCVPAV